MVISRHLNNHSDFLFKHEFKINRRKLLNWSCLIRYTKVWFLVFTAGLMSVRFFWDMTLCRLAIISDVSKLRGGSIDGQWNKYLSVFLVTENISFLQSVILRQDTPKGQSLLNALFITELLIKTCVPNNWTTGMTRPIVWWELYRISECICLLAGFFAVPPSSL